MNSDNVLSFLAGGRNSSRSDASGKESSEARDLAPFIYAADQRLGRARLNVPFDGLAPEHRDSYVTRAAIAVRLGDPVKAVALCEHAALGILADVIKRIRSKQLDASHPETKIELARWRVLARVAILRGFEYLGSTTGVRSGL